MKRLISLILAVALLLSLAPAVFAEGEETGGVALTFGTMREVEQQVYNSTDVVTYYAIPVSVKNTTNEAVILSALQCYFNYDVAGFEPANIKTSRFASVKEVTFLEPVSLWGNKETNAANGRISVITATTDEECYVVVEPNGTYPLFELNLVRKSDIENGDYYVSFADPFLNEDGAQMENKIGFDGELDGTTVKKSYSQSDGNLNLTDKGAIPITDGNPPTISKVAISPEATTGYASGEEFTLSAESGSGKNITSHVNFKVQKDGTDYTTGLTIDRAKLKVESTGVLANAGTYTVVAVPNGADCTGSAWAEFTITQKTITAPTVTIVGFGKGAAVGDVKYSANDLTAALSWYEGEGDPNTLTAVSAADKFKADTTYTLVLTLTPANDNYVLDPDATVTVKNFGEERTVALESGVAVIAAKTADKDVPELTLTPIDATYGDKLFNYNPTGTANFGGQPVEGTFAWSTEYDANTTVRDVGEQTFNVVFTPTNTDLYATVTGTVTVIVAQKEIEFKKADYAWQSINPDDAYTVDSYGRMRFQYDGKEHGIEPICNNEDIRALVGFEYVTPSTTNKSINVTGATVKARVLLKNNNYKFDKDSTIINDGDWSVDPIVIDYAGEYTYSVDVCYTTSSVNIPLSAFKLPAEVLNDTNNKYLMRTDALVAGDGDVISGSPTAFDDTTRTLTLNLARLEKTDAGKTATVTLGLKVNNYETTNTGVAGIAGGEEKLFILKLNVGIIEKGDAGLTITGIPETLTLVYGESAEWSYNVTNPGENGHISDSVTPAGILNNDPHKLTAIGVGEATVTITYSSDTTYAQREFTIIVTPKPLTATVSHAPITYGDPAPTEGYTVEFNGLVNGDKITDYTVGTEYTAGKPAGTYKITCALGDSIKNYTLEAKDVTGELVVKPKQLTAEDVTVTVLGETPVYDGSEKKPSVEVKYGETTLAAADYTVSYSNNVNAGVNTASVTVTSNDNSSYKFTATKTFTIEAASLSGCTISPIEAVTYNAKAQEPDVTVTFGETTLTAADYTVSYASNVKAGTATVTVTAKENGNFTGTKTTTFEIKKANLTLSPYTISKLCTETEVTTETLPSNFFLAGEQETRFSIALKATENVDDIFAKDGTPAVVEGENKITFRLKEVDGEATYTVTVTPTSDNYKEDSYALTISAYAKSNISGSISFPDGSAVYTGTGLKYENATVSGYSGTLHYGYTPDASTSASLDASGLPLTVGSYTVSAAISTSSVYGYKTATFTITKATPTGTPSFTKIETSGKTLADTKLTVGTIRPAGAIAWDLPATTEVEANKEYTWTFTPTDKHNYKPLTGRLTPYVVSDMPYLPGVIGNTGSFSFRDVSRFDYFYDAVKWASENGIASGTSNYTFSPDAVCTRAQTVTFLWRAAGSPMPRYRVSPFTDVNAYDYYYNAVLWAVEQGITTGLTATTFGPDETVTRGQVATFLYRAASAAKPNTFNPFTDVKATAYNYNAILWAYDNRITTGTSTTTFSPDASCTRAQIVTFLYRYYQGR